MSNLEKALRELEVATAASIRIPLGDPEGARAIVRQRAKAVDAVAELTPVLAALPDAQRAEAISRLQSALAAGEQARQQILASKRSLILEWGRWRQVLLALAPPPAARSGKLDCRG